jgi:hypothetical protein
VSADEYRREVSLEISGMEYLREGAEPILVIDKEIRVKVDDMTFVCKVDLVSECAGVRQWRARTPPS